ncbi:hypothetical protein C457_00035 [Haloferax prahovense DSM 18310]|uniref:Uncharacterized protein n=1 Tax=Haloferax prahovense (strain DSM 18310 / JCM 13924 / TL6) TaxID=1227461 RepID=M0GRK6_HALPT|nr:hypothetical protein C457_00035 [Haloferax prahovense DSM 18310]
MTVTWPPGNGFWKDALDRIVYGPFVVCAVFLSASVEYEYLFGTSDPHVKYSAGLVGILSDEIFVEH